MPILVLLRHGQSDWNLEQRFTGWVELDLSEKGVAEARAAGWLLAERGFDFDLCFTSLHTCAIKTLGLVLDEMDRLWLPVEKHWRLNERHYGGLTGLYHSDVATKYGDEQVQIWHHSFHVPPPSVEPGSEWNFSGDRRYAGVTMPEQREPQGYDRARASLLERTHRTRSPGMPARPDLRPRQLLARPDQAPSRNPQ